MAYDRNKIIKLSIENGSTLEQTNKALALAGEKPVGISDWAGNAVTNAKNFARDFKTLGGAIARPIMELGDEVAAAPLNEKEEALRRAFLKAANNPTIKSVTKGAAIGGLAGSVVPGVGTLSGAILGGTTGLLGGPKNMANAMLSTYNTTVDDIVNRNIDINKIKAGIYENPLYAGLDLLSLGGAKALRSGAKALGASVPKNAPLALQQILPSPELREFNRSVTESLGASRAQQAPLYKGYNTLETMPLANRTELVKDIVTGNGNLTNKERLLSSQIKKDLRANEELASSMELMDMKEAIDNAKAQYIMAKLQDKYPELLFTDVYNKISGQGPLSQRFLDIARNSNGELIREIGELTGEADRLYRDKQIVYLTQAMSPTQDPLGQVIASNIVEPNAGYFGTKRIIGRTTPEAWGSNLGEALQHQLSQVGKVKEMRDVVGDLLNNNKIATKLDKAIDVLPQGKVAINKDLFNKALADIFRTEGRLDIGAAIKRSKNFEKGSYLVDEIYTKALENAFKTYKTGNTNKFLSSFKKAVLAQPHWIALNRIGNMTNNAMGGVTLGDYHDALAYSKLIPDRLNQQVSFNSYVNMGAEGIKSTKADWVKQPLNRMTSAFRKFNKTSKGLGDYGDLATSLYSGSSDLFANPFFKLESTLERQDRYANFIRQAKRESERTGKDWKSIVKKANTDDALYNKLNTAVNKDLGDYLGRNYAMPSGLYDTLSELVPFYKFLFQTGRTTTHQLANHPLAFQSTVMAPAKAGKDLSQSVIDYYNLDPEKYEGGVYYKTTPWGDIRTVGIEPLPAQAVAKDMANFLSANNMTNFASPLITTWSDILKYRHGDRIPTSVRYINAKINNPSEADNYKPTPTEASLYALAQILGTTNAEYRMATNYIPNIYQAIQAGLGNKVNIQSPYEVEFWKRNPRSYPKTTPAELIGRWFSLQTDTNYPKSKKGKSAIQKNMRKSAREKQQVIQKVNYNK